MFVIYLIRNLINGKIYVGQTMQGLSKRMKQHAYEASRRCAYFLERAIAKWGKENFTIESLIEGIDSWQEANRLETYWIKELKSNDRSIGYNLSEGGEGIRDETGEVRRKLSASLKKHYGENPKANPAYRHDVPTDDLLRMHKEGVPIETMAGKYGVSISLIYRRFKKLDVPLSRNMKNLEEDIRRLYCEDKYTTTEIAAILDISPSKAHQSLARQGVESRPAGSRPRLAHKEEKRCPGCGIIKSMSEYNRSKKSLDGHCTRCRGCENTQSRRYKSETKKNLRNGTFERKFPDRDYVADRSEKKCCRCKTIFPLDQFTNDKNNPDGKGSYCPDCRKIRDKERRDKQKKASLLGGNEAGLATVSEFPSRSCSGNAGTPGLADVVPELNPSPIYEGISFGSGTTEAARPAAL
jgi:group I intron endonuclease